MRNGKACKAEMTSEAKRVPACEAKGKPPAARGLRFLLLVILAVFLMFSGVTGCGAFMPGAPNSDTAPAADRNSASSANSTVSSKSSVFDGDCGIAASAEMGTDIIGYPTLTISIQNTSDKDISAIQFYAVPYDVYGEEITGLFGSTQRHLFTDDPIAAGQSDQLYYDPFIETSIKTVKLYVYSVYFADGTEWGDKDATKSTILSKGALIEVSGGT